MDKKAISLTVVAVMILCAVAVPFAGEVDAAGFDIKDGTGKTIHYDSPADYIISIGKGATATVIELGGLDKIVVVDKYSNDPEEEVFDGLNERIEKGEVKAGGTVYSSGIEQLKKDILDSADPEQGGVFDKKDDAIILTASKTYADPLYDYLVDKGFEKVMVWYDIPEYEQIVEFVEDISLVLTGGTSDLVEQMRYVPQVIEEKLADEGVPAKKAFYVTYSGNTFKVGNTGSIATSLIVAAGGDAYTVDPSKPTPTYEASLPEIYEKGDSPIVFADKNIWSNADKMNQLRIMLPGAVIVNVEALWNNFCPDSMYGVWAMACAMYPDIFEGDIPVAPQPADSNAMLYAGIAIAVVAVFGVGLFLYMRQRSV